MTLLLVGPATRLIRPAVALATLAVALLAVPALAQDATPWRPSTDALLRKIPVSIISLEPEPMNGAGCSSGPLAGAARTTLNPISGEKQAEQFVVIPLTAGSGSAAQATTRAQQAFTCGL